MTPDELVANLAPVDLERLRLIFLYVATNAYELTLADGRRLLDGTDWKEFFHQLGDVLGEAGAGTGFKLPRDYKCSDCGHVHEDKAECRVYLGEGRFCPCESKVAA